MKYIKILVVVTVLVLAATVVVQAQQHQQLPGIIKNGFKLCQDGMGESVINPKVRIPWSEVLELSGNAEVKSVPASSRALIKTKTVSAVSVPIETVQSAVPIDPVPKESAKNEPKSAAELNKEYKKFKAAAKCRHGQDSTGECWEPWAKSLPPAAVYRIDHPGVRLSQGLAEGEGVTISGGVVKSK